MYQEWGGKCDKVQRRKEFSEHALYRTENSGNMYTNYEREEKKELKSCSTSRFGNIANILASRNRTRWQVENRILVHAERYVETNFDHSCHMIATS